MKVLNILMAEDNPGGVPILRELLNEYNVACHLHMETDEEAAIQFLETTGGVSYPDLFVLDMQMPKVGGLVVAQNIRERPQFLTRPIILLSSFFNPKEQTKAKTIPLCFLFKKPLSLAEWSGMGQFIRTICDPSDQIPSYSEPYTVRFSKVRNCSQPSGFAITTGDRRRRGWPRSNSRH